jgi:hypothetical protein
VCPPWRNFSWSGEALTRPKRDFAQTKNLVMPWAQADSINSPGEHTMPILSEARSVTLSNDNIVLER